MKTITVKNYLQNVLPIGTYEAIVVSAEEQLSRDGLSEYVNVTLAVGESRRRVFDRFLTSHSNPDAVAVGLTRLCSLANAIGLETLSSAEELLGGKVLVDLGVEDDSDRGEFNVVKRYLPKVAPDEVTYFKNDENVPF